MSIPRLVSVFLCLTLLAPASATTAQTAAPAGARTTATIGGGPAASPRLSATTAPRLGISALGINRPIHTWGCRGGTLPDRVWSWTCSGHNNLYLLGHAYGVFKPLHDAYASGTLRRGMRLVIRSALGQKQVFRLAWVRLVPASALGTDMWGPGRTWAWNATARPVVTLQTCFGPTSAFRIIARFKLLN